PVAPAAETDPATEPVAPTPDPTDDAPLGPAGEKALIEWKQRAKAAEAQARTLAAEVEAARIAALDEGQRAIEEARAAGRTEALAETQARLFAAEVKVASRNLADPTLLADPDVALKLLGLPAVPVTPTGDIDTE